MTCRPSISVAFSKLNAPLVRRDRIRVAAGTAIIALSWVILIGCGIAAICLERTAGAF